MKKKIIGAIIGVSLIFSTNIYAFAQTIDYSVKYGDTYWKISQRYHLNLNELMKENNAGSNPYLYIGQKIVLPYDSSKFTLYKVQYADTYWKISQKFNVDISILMDANNSEDGYLEAGDILFIPVPQSLTTNNSIKSEQTSNTIEYKNYIVQKGDDTWKISIKFGIPQYELMKVNGLNENSILYVGDVLTIPVHHVAVKSTVGDKYGEYLDWWTEAQYVISINKTFVVKDFYTGKEWTMKRTIGANHADCEPLTYNDAQIMKEVWGGNYSWNTRPVLILVDGRKVAASASAMPHDIQYIKNNGVTGHMDIHFANSTRHKDGQIDSRHQENVKIAAGYK